MVTQSPYIVTNKMALKELEMNNFVSRS